MIAIGVCSMAFFLLNLLHPLQVGYPLFYWLLMAATIFNCLRVLHEWYHYLYITVPPVPPLKKDFTVDIFTTFCAGEPYPMIVETLEAIQAIRYPHNTYLCDEADDPYLKEVCKRLGVHHVTRTIKKDAKAGNINNALQRSGGELCVVLDPDHVPEPEFLDYVIPYFSDDKVGFVQVVQAYDNLKDSLVAKGAAQQTFQFYGPMMMTMNRYGTVLAIGANCTFRRTALESIGGHAAGLSEDMHTAMQLHAKGWQSVYVPAVLTYGLVPSTLSAYYKQQLKWARGTFELLVTTYPKLFKHFSWRQRLHYGTIPFHYFSGVIFLINFLVPILSLLTGLIPFRMDLLSFALVGLPFMSATLAIRHFVQRWVMGENERGNHALGGLLLIGTWWIYILGLVYTIIRKKVPYIPTPKDDSEPDNWSLNIPNGIIALASLSAIVYGLYTDWNPYAWVMAGIAGINCLIMLFNIMISRRNDLRRLKARFIILKQLFARWLELKQLLWDFRHGLYTGIRRFALLLVLGVSFTALYFLTGASKVPSHTPRFRFKQHIFYSGLFSPAKPGGLTSMQEVADYQRRYNTRFNIISLYIPWEAKERSYVPLSLMYDIYRNGSYPMITWEPWGAKLADIYNGGFDRYLEKFAIQLRSVDRPVYLRFAHEPDNPFYPWSSGSGNTPEDYRKAWRYVHDFFVQHKVYNIIWVWNPWKVENVDAYYPGTGYVDWLGVTCLNYGAYNPDGKAYTFKQLYAPFHRHPLFRSGLPVMVSETGSLRSEGSQEKWLTDAFVAIDQQFAEIKGFVLFNSDMDRNVPGGADSVTLQWKLQRPGAFFTAITAYQASRGYKSAYRDQPLPALAIYNSVVKERRPLPRDIRGVHYQKGQHWYKNFHALTRREIIRDFKDMQRLGINTIRREGPGVYDRNILSAAADYHMQVHYSFQVPEMPDVIRDMDQLSALADEITATVEALKDNRSIIAWNIGDNLWQQLGERFYKPSLLYQQQAYITWLKKLLIRIREIDPLRPVTMDVSLNNRLAATLPALQLQLSEVDAFGLVIGEDTSGLAQLRELPAPCFISRVAVPQYVQLAGRQMGAFITAWQDTGEKDYLSFDGLVDHWGHHKPAWYQLGECWGKQQAVTALPELKILRPAKLAKPGASLTYRALARNNGHWASVQPAANIRYEWRLVRTDRWGYPLMMEEVGEGPALTLSIPENPGVYRLYLVAVAGERSATALSELHLPIR
jgi:cellulose synthase/poly-beta-1,6-N-acetylglucosamine synthase-like glycosyltransferase